jgi:hypothetical protein
MIKEYTVKIDGFGTKRWYQNGLIHRDDGPAVECSNGSKMWFLNGKRHREDGPAIEYTDGTKSWWLNDELHRGDGPAAEFANGKKLWYLHGEELDEEQFNAKIKKNSCSNKIVEIDGIKYKIVPL